MPVNVLPDMDEPRLKSLGKQLNRNRKSSLIHSDKLKERFDVYVKSINKAQKSLNGKYNNRSTRLKKSLAQTRGTQKVLRAKREQTFWEDSDEYPYGIYEGERLDSFRREVEHIIEQKHPKIRRQRKVDKHLQNGKAQGKILDDEEAKMQFNMIMSKDRKTQYLNKEDPLTRTTFFKRALPNRLEQLLENINDQQSPDTKVKNWRLRKEPKDIKVEQVSRKTHNPRIDKLRNINLPRLDSPNDSGVFTPSVFSEEEIITVESSPAKLTLPPIAAKTEHVTNKRNKEQSSHSKLPDLSIRRATKGDIATLNKTQLDRLKNRRATTFIF